jgi:integrase
VATSTRLPVASKSRVLSQSTVRAELETDGGRHKLGELLDAWLVHNERRFRPKTIDGYVGYIECRIRPLLGEVFLDRLTTPMLDRTYAEWSKELHPPTVRHLHATISAAINQGIRWGWLNRSPGSLASVLPPTFREFAVLTPHQFRELYLQAKTYNSILATAIAIAGLTGARRGELLGLRWSDVDYEGKAMVIRRSILEVRGVLYIRPTKAKRQRKLALDSSSIRILRGREDEVRFAASAQGSSLTDDAYVLSRAVDASTPVVPNKITHDFGYLSQRMNIGIRFRDLRHFAVTMLISSGVDVKTVAERHGNAHSSMTLDRYAHFMPARDREAADLLGRTPGLPVQRVDP